MSFPELKTLPELSLDGGSGATRPIPKDSTIHTSVILKELISEVESEHFTLDWLIGHLPKHSFGVIMLFLALISLLPVISVISRLMIIILTIQIIFGYHSPVLPRRLLMRPLPSKYLSRLNRHAIPALQHLEKVIRPRWPKILVAARRVTALIALILTIVSLLAPVPLANVPPATLCVLMALAYIEHDGVLLALSLTVAITMMTILIVTII